MDKIGIVGMGDGVMVAIASMSSNHYLHISPAALIAMVNNPGSDAIARAGRVPGTRKAKDGKEDTGKTQVLARYRNGELRCAEGKEIGGQINSNKDIGDKYVFTLDHAKVTAIANGLQANDEVDILEQRLQDIYKARRNDTSRIISTTTGLDF